MLQKNLGIRNEYQEVEDTRKFSKKTNNNVEIGTTSPNKLHVSEDINKLKPVDIEEIRSNDSSPLVKRSESDGQSPIRKQPSPERAVVDSPHKVSVPRFNK